MLRRQLPVYSPLSWSAIGAGVAALVGADHDGLLHDRVVDLLKSRYGAQDVLLTDSGTSALRLAIEGAIREDDGAVALPGFSCYDLATAAEGAGARVALYDVDPGTLGPDTGSLEAARGGGLAAVVVTHLYGYPVDIESVQGCVGDALVIEDAAQAVGGKLNGHLLGSIGPVSILSFGRGKGMTGGGGGALVANDDRGEEILRFARERLGGKVQGAGCRVQGAGGQPPNRPTAQPHGLRNVAALLAQHTLGRPSLYGIPSALPFLHLGETLYHSPWEPGAMPVASVAVLERVMAEVDREARIRSQTAGRLLEAAQRSERVQTIAPVAGAEPGYLRLPVLAPAGTRDTLTTAAIKRRGVMPVYPTRLKELPSLAPHLVGVPHLPGSARLAKDLLTVPTHRLLSEGDLAAIEEWLGG